MYSLTAVLIIASTLVACAPTPPPLPEVGRWYPINNRATVAATPAATVAPASSPGTGQ